MSRYASLLAIALSASVCLGLLWLLFRDSDPREIFAYSMEANMGLLALASITFLVSLLFRIARMRSILMRPQDSLVPYFVAVQISSLAEMLIPLNGGLFVKPLLLQRWLKLSFAKLLSACGADRLMEIAGLFAIALIMVFTWPLTQPLVLPAQTLGTTSSVQINESLLRSGTFTFGVILGGLVGAAILYRLFADRMGNLLRNLIPAVGVRIARVLENLSLGLDFLTSPSRIALVSFLNAGFWGAYLASFHLAYTAFGVSTPWYASLLCVSFLVFTQVGPNAPLLVGQYHLANVLALLAIAPDIPVERAKAIAVVVHIMHYGLLIITATFAFFVELNRRRGASNPGQSECID